LEQLIKIAESLNISEEEKQLLFAEIKAVKKNMSVIEFKYNRTLVDKAAITNVLNASIREIENQKKNIEIAKNEINRNLIELDKQKKLIEEKNNELNDALTNLKETQSQLIQSEKMASLGELTAGIAHEIQNPLNFVNNFSEVSNELIDEMNEDLNKGDIEEAKAIAKDVKQNLEKINHHGKRADAIVKGMLQHSRSSSGVKEPTDINALADEYLRLAYHGLRAKDKSFNATMKTDYDKSLTAGETGIGNINIVPQDIGRVILNLITNAFYAVTEKKKQLGEGYEPTVTVNTKKINGKIEVSVKDNGNGIPQKVLDKIFQPFFTTKPTGQGTGLGLSLSYDIVKAHGGEIKVHTKENEGTEFTISLPA
jgi:signal transduction histidine kinase